MEELDYSDPLQMMAQLGMEPGSAIAGDGTLPEDFLSEIGGELPEGLSFEGGGEGGPGGGVIMSGAGFVPGEEGTEFDPEALATAQAERGSGFANRQSLMFLPALIEYLEEVAAP